MIEFPPTIIEYNAEILNGDVLLRGDLSIVDEGKGLVAFAHGSGSSRRSPRNRAVAAGLQREGLSTLLFDLLTEDEDRRDRSTGVLRFDIGLLTGRLVAAIEWLERDPRTENLEIGLFGASTGAAAALVAAARKPDSVAAVVSRGGRPDLADEALERVQAPTLLIVGGSDEMVYDLNRRAFARLSCVKRLEVIPGATHLFEEPGALDAVTGLAEHWFDRYL